MSDLDIKLGPANFRTDPEVDGLRRRARAFEHAIDDAVDALENSTSLTLNQRVAAVARLRYALMGRRSLPKGRCL